MPSQYKYYRLFIRMLQGENIDSDFSWYMDMDGEPGVSAFRDILFASIEKQGAFVTDRIPVSALRKINELVRVKFPEAAA